MLVYEIGSGMAGCWTCRLRRKKCDEARPVCAACEALQIDCHYSDAKPGWMDGGARERQMADELKAMVRQKASERRDRKWAQLPTLMDLSPSTQEEQQQQQQQKLGHQSSDHPMSDSGAPMPSDDDNDNDVVEDDDDDDDDDATGSGSGTQPSAVPSASPPSQPDTHATSLGTSPASHAPWEPHYAAAAAAAGDAHDYPEDKSELEVKFTMIYLDYVVPFLFPFYRPCIFESSRGWMLVLLMKNRALYHTALSLANWLFAVLLDDSIAITTTTTTTTTTTNSSSSGGGVDGSGNGRDDSDGSTHSECRRANWAELQAHQGVALRALAEDVRRLGLRGGVAGSLRGGVACLQGVVQLLEFEVAMAGAVAAGTWPAHRDAAVALLGQLVAHHATPTDRDGAPSTPWASVMDRIGLPYRRLLLGGGGGGGRRRPLLTSDQSAFLFYTARLLWIDVLAATADGEAPRLRAYHDELLRGDDPRVRLGEYVGCHSWAVAEIAEIAELAAWKKRAGRAAAGSPSAVELARRSGAVSSRIRRRLADLGPLPGAAAAVGPASDIYDPSAHHPVTPYSGFHGDDVSAATTPAARSAPAVDLHTRIWAQAALMYAGVVASGLQPERPEIRASVLAAIDLFRALPSPLAVRTLVWPFAVAGCLALPEQRPFFVDFVARLGAVRVFGAVTEALDVMRAVWAHGADGCLDPQMWDIATCFSLLGHNSLMV
ncbi:putative c6 transcription [Rosellinia necatrix]|uniref:Putative c6 transcription n=1 Tax=Rosellinia necatrix TaxID=77044 RepID=A0A1W2TBI9_ROSNE|nr:putative c6 transcription [Rosellinia necatrix]